jgi:hypothetical protein
MASSFKSYANSSIGVSNTAVFTASASTTVIGFSIANITESAVKASAFLEKSGAGTSFIVKDAPIPAGGSLIAVGSEQKVVLETGDVLSIYANTASSVDTIVSTLELS